MKTMKEMLRRYGELCVALHSVAVTNDYPDTRKGTVQRRDDVVLIQSIDEQIALLEWLVE